MREILGHGQQSTYPVLKVTSQEAAYGDVVLQLQLLYQLIAMWPKINSNMNSNKAVAGLELNKVCYLKNAASLHSRSRYSHNEPDIK